MASTTSREYPVHLNPFGSDDEGEEGDGISVTGKGNLNQTTASDNYPNHLSPFAEEDEERGGTGRGSENKKESEISADDYDESLNPFGEEDDCIEIPKLDDEPSRNIRKILEECELKDPSEFLNPFGEEDEQDEHSLADHLEPERTGGADSRPSSVQQDSLEVPPIPLPRTKSLLKKEKALKEKSLREQQLQSNHVDSNHAISLQSIASSSSSTSTTTATSSAKPAMLALNSEGSLPRRKPKRCAPPVPVNFKRQVSGSLNAIEDELNGIGDELSLLENEFHECETNLKKTYQIDETEFCQHKETFIDIIKRRSSIVRRQKELMYRKRELKLDQTHSDIEYELRLIGNKQISARTAEDRSREEELLKRLVEIVEEKNDIVENLNKDTSCINSDVEEAFRRLNISTQLVESLDKERVDELRHKSKGKNGDCDKPTLSLSASAKLNKIATLLPTAGTFKGTMKLKRKHLFKKSGQRSIER